MYKHLEWPTKGSYQRNINSIFQKTIGPNMGELYPLRFWSTIFITL